MYLDTLCTWFYFLFIIFFYIEILLENYSELSIGSLFFVIYSFLLSPQKYNSMLSHDR